MNYRSIFTLRTNKMKPQSTSLNIHCKYKNIPICSRANIYKYTYIYHYLHKSQIHQAINQAIN